MPGPSSDAQDSRRLLVSGSQSQTGQPGPRKVPWARGRQPRGSCSGPAGLGVDKRPEVKHRPFKTSLPWAWNTLAQKGDSQTDGQMGRQPHGWHWLRIWELLLVWSQPPSTETASQTLQCPQACHIWALLWIGGHLTLPNPPPSCSARTRPGESVHSWSPCQAALPWYSGHRHRGQGQPRAPTRVSVLDRGRGAPCPAQRVGIGVQQRLSLVPGAGWRRTWTLSDRPSDPSGLPGPCTHCNSPSPGFPVWVVGMVTSPTQPELSVMALEDQAWTMEGRFPEVGAERTWNEMRCPPPRPSWGHTTRACHWAPNPPYCLPTSHQWGPGSVPCQTPSWTTPAPGQVTVECQRPALSGVYVPSQGPVPMSLVTSDGETPRCALPNHPNVP